MKLHPLVTLGILSIAPALADEESAKEMEMLISGLPYIGTAPSSAIGTNLDGDSVFTNMQSAITNDQFCLRWVGMVQYENPTAAVATPAKAAAVPRRCRRVMLRVVMMVPHWCLIGGMVCHMRR